MSLRFYLGASGSGKSTALYQEIISRSMKDPDRQYLVIVPEQSTLQAQTDLVRLHPRKGIMNIDVLSFGRMTHRVFEEVDGRVLPVLDDTGKSLVLRRIAGQLKGQTRLIGGNLDKTGYIHEIKSALSEFMQYGIGQEELKRLTEYAAGRGSLYYKLQDLGVLYQGFRDYIDGRALTQEELLLGLGEKLPFSTLVRGNVVALDGFTGFTPVQNLVLRQIMELAEEVIVTAQLDPAAEDTGAAKENEQDLFYLSRKMVSSLTRIAAEAGVARGEDILFTSRPVRRLAQNPTLAHLESRLFRYPLKPYAGKTDGRLRLLEASDRQEEVRQVLIAIREYLRATGCCYRDVAIIAGDLSSYEQLLVSEADRYGIPLYLDRTRGITLNPFIEFIKSALRIIEDNYSYDAVFCYLRSGMADLSAEETDELELYVQETGIRGKKKWHTLFTARTKGMPQDQAVSRLERLNRSRVKLVTQLEPLEADCANVREMVEGLYAFLVRSGAQERLKEYEEYFAAEGQQSLSKEYAQIYRLVMDLLDQIVGLIGEETVKRKEFIRILEAGFEEIRVGTVPLDVDRVVVGDVERTRLRQIKALFFIGVNDGAIPRLSQAGGLLSDMDREFLRGSGLELAPGAREQMVIQRLYLYLHLTKPSDQLVVSFSRMGEDGKALRPSYLIGTLKRLFPEITIEHPQERPLSQQVQTEQDGRPLFAKALREYADGLLPENSESEEEFAALCRTYAGREGTAEWTRAMIDTAFYIYKDRPLGRDAAVALFGLTVSGSISRFETYAGCAYAHFLQYGLGLKEQEPYEFGAADQGNLYHEVLEAFSKELTRRGYSWFDFPGEEAGEILDRAIESYAASYRNGLLYDTARNTYTMKRLKRVLLRTVNTLQYQLKKGRFVPEDFELSFDSIKELDPTDANLPKDGRLRLRGRIDRLDTWVDEDRADCATQPAAEAENGIGGTMPEAAAKAEDGVASTAASASQTSEPGQTDPHRSVYVKVMDYKSGSRDFDLVSLYYGLQLQLSVYMNAAMELERKRHPDARVVPAAMLYYRVQDPLTDAGTAFRMPEGSPEEDKELERQQHKELRMTGMVNSEEKIVRGLDQEIDKRSDVIPVGFKSDGTYDASSRVLPEEAFETISAYTERMIRGIGSRILSGDIRLDPYLEHGATPGEGRDACTYCDFKRVCGFDRRLPGHRMRQLEDPDQEEVLRRMKK